MLTDELCPTCSDHRLSVHEDTKLRSCAHCDEPDFSLLLSNRKVFHPPNIDGGQHA